MTKTSYYRHHLVRTDNRTYKQCDKKKVSLVNASLTISAWLQQQALCRASSPRLLTISWWAPAVFNNMLTRKLKPRLYQQRYLKDISYRGTLTKFYFPKTSLPGIEVLIVKLLPNILGRLGKGNPYVQLVKQKLVYACRAAMSVILYVYALRNYSSECLRQSDTPPGAAGRHTTLQLAFWETSRLRA